MTTENLWNASYDAVTNIVLTQRNELNLDQQLMLAQIQALLAIGQELQQGQGH